MYNWFECKVRYEKEIEGGLVKVVTEPYLVDALSFTEAEARIIEEMKPYISGEFSISDIKRVKYTDSFFDETGDRYYKVKIYLISLDEKSGSEKKTAINILVQSSTLKESIEKIEEEMKKTLNEYTIASVNETSILDVFHYKNKD